MIVRSLRIALGTAVLAAVASAAQPPGVVEPGPRPPLPVFDPADVLTPAQESEIGAPLVTLREKELIDVVVVVVPDLGEAPVEHVARQFAETWCLDGANGVVIHQPGRPDSPRIVPGGRVVRELRPGIVEQPIAAAERRASLEPDDFDKVRAATVETADLLRVWVGTAIQISETTITRRTRMRLEHEQALQRWKILLLGAAGSFIPLLLGGLTLFFAVRRRRFSRFPAIRWQHRLGAPHAGGNHAVIDLGPPPTAP